MLHMLWGKANQSTFKKMMWQVDLAATCCNEANASQSMHVNPIAAFCPMKPSSRHTKHTLLLYETEPPK
jgi:hypothetical protein